MDFPEVKDGVDHQIEDPLFRRGGVAQCIKATDRIFANTYTREGRLASVVLSVHS